MRPVIQAEKHYVQHPTFSLAASSIVQKTVATAVQVLNKDATHEVEEGSIIKAIYFEFWALSGGGGPNFAVSTIEKISSDGPDQTLANSLNLGAYLNKKNIFYTFQGLIPPSAANPIPVIRQWLRIPKGKQRMGLGDKIVINFTADADTKSVCGFTTYKEYK